MLLFKCIVLLDISTETLIQWCVHGQLNKDSTTAFTFPLTFPRGVFVILNTDTLEKTSGNVTSSACIQGSSVTKRGFSFVQDTYTTSGGYVLAVGY